MSREAVRWAETAVWRAGAYGDSCEGRIVLLQDIHSCQAFHAGFAVHIGKQGIIGQHSRLIYRVLDQTHHSQMLWFGIPVHLHRSNQATPHIAHEERLHDSRALDKLHGQPPIMR